MRLNAPETARSRYGEAEREIRRIFEKAAVNEPAVIVIDEIDALCGLRQERRVVGALCGEMERVCGEDRRVVVVGATNRVGAVDPSEEGGQV